MSRQTKAQLMDENAELQKTVMELQARLETMTGQAKIEKGMALTSKCTRCGKRVNVSLRKPVNAKCVDCFEHVVIFNLE